MILIPFNPDWADSGMKLDLKGVYQATAPGDDRICNALPIRRHNDWIRKGLKFVTLSTLEDVKEAQDYIRMKGISLSELKHSYLMQGVGPFNVQQYLKEQPDREASEADALRARLAQIEGKQTRQSDPDADGDEQTLIRRKPGRPPKAQPAETHA